MRSDFTEKTTERDNRFNNFATDISARDSHQSNIVDQATRIGKVDRETMLTDDLISRGGSSSMISDTNDYGYPAIFGNNSDMVVDAMDDEAQTTKVGRITPPNMATPKTILVPNPFTRNNSTMRKSSLTRDTNRVKWQRNSNGKSEGNELEASTDQDLEQITQQMGKLWYPSSVQDFTKQFERDKYGRLVPSTEDRDAKGRIGSRSYSPTDGNCSSSAHSEVSMKSSYSEWYDKAISSVHAATTNLVGKGVQNDTEVYEQKDPKLQTSMALTKTIDKVWAKELYDMDADDRENIINEIHGIKSKRAIKETQESINEAIISFRSFLETNLDQELDNRDSIVPPVTKDPYRRAVSELWSDYITSKPFLIKFLRICHYNFEDAALRYFRYLDLLHLLFGDDSLTRPLELTDLTKRELRYLRKGQMQLLPSRDRAGRRIFAFSGCDDWQFNIREKYRINIYLIDVLSDDITTQKLGAVSLNAPRVRYDIGDNPFGFEGMTLRVGKQELLGGKCTEAQFFRKINEAVPIRFSAIHYFAPPTIIYNIGRAIILSLLGKDHWKIVRFHAGSQLECNYSLRSFGIPHEDITITEGNNIKTKNVQKFINARRSIESFRQNQREKRAQMKEQQQPLEEMYPSIEEECPGIECPGVDCIVFGDKAWNGLPANIEFREMLKLMERQREESLNSSEGHILPIKQFIESIIEKARSPEHNLRFLVFDKQSSLFIDIRDYNELCKRVSQALRDQRKRSKLVASHGQGPSHATSPTDGSSHKSTVGQGLAVSLSSRGDVLEEAGASIMGLAAAKRLKRSYDRGSTSNSVARYLFCTDAGANVSEQNQASILR